jgi:uncharacterized protein
VERLADGVADIEFAVPLAELTGLRSLRAGVAGSARGHARFSREQGVAVAELTLHGSATLECQRCMRPMELPLDMVTRVALIASEAEAARVPGDLEPVLAAGGRISIGELVTEELLLTLPIVPLHGDGALCASAAAAPTAQQDGGETHRPFGRLAELLKRQV